MNLIRDALIPLVILLLFEVHQAHAQWIIRPIIVSYDTLPRTRKISTITKTLNVKVLDDDIYFNDEHGVFIATCDSIIPIVTEMDTIPGLSRRFDDFNKNGGDFRILAPRKAGFVYAVKNRTNYFTAGPEGISLFGRLPDTVICNGRPFYMAKSGGISAWTMEEGASGITVYLLWNKRSRGFIHDDLTSGFFSFDGTNVTKLLAAGDSYMSEDSLRILSVDGIFNGPHFARDRQTDQWMLQSTYSGRNPLSGQWKSESGILLLDHEHVTSVVQAGDSIVDQPPGRLPTLLEMLAKNYFGHPEQSITWQPDFNTSSVMLLSSCMTTTWNQGFFRAKGGIVRRLASWACGDGLPSTSGGHIGRFSVMRSNGSRSPMVVENFIVTGERPTVTSIVDIASSKAHVDEGIFRSEGGIIRKLAAKGDSVVGGKARVVTEVNEFTYLGSSDDLVFKARVDNTDRDEAILISSGGKINEIVSTVRGGVIDRRRPGKGRPINFTFIGSFVVLRGERILFSAGSPTVSGWFLAERSK